MKTFKLAAVTLSLIAATMQIHADQTNRVQTLHLGLSALKQGGTTTNRNTVVTSVDSEQVDARDVIAAIGAVTGYNFSRASRLALVTPVDGGAATIEIRDRALKVEVTGFFVFEQVGASVTRSVQLLRTGDFASATSSIRRLALQDHPAYSPLALHFDVRGLGVDTSNSRDEIGPRRDLRASVSGNGDSNGAPTVLDGSISTSVGDVEVVSGGGLPPPV